jgi:DNA helicase-2/ATP-dependent DNA helicase PcrA
MKKFTLKKPSYEPRDPSSYTINYEKLLNEAQMKAVFHQKGPALVIAGAGTGKTRTLTYRVSRLIEDGVPPEQILLLTFTRRAAAQMLERATSLLDERCQKVKGGTFHHYCSQILYRFGNKIGLSDSFTIIDPGDAEDVIQLIRQPWQSEYKNERFPSKKALFHIISTHLNKQVPVVDVLEDEFKRFQKFHDHIIEIEQQYQDYKHANGLLDFDDLLIQTKFLLEDQEDMRAYIAGRNRHVLVDEYQDTNRLQADLIALLSSKFNNVMAVGDDAQSIYSFRGADLNNMFEFPERFSDTSIIRLEENYRSTQQILDLANTLIARASRKFDKTLRSPKTDGDLPGLIKTQDEREQSQFVTQMILHMREQQIELSDMAVLFRNGRDSYDLEVELNRSNIPFVKFGGQKITEAAHIKDVLAHLRVLYNPEDEIAWNRILMLIDGIGPKSAGELINWIKSGGQNRVERLQTASDKYLNKLKSLLSLFGKMKPVMDQPGELVTFVNTYYIPICKKKFDDAQKRTEDLENFEKIAAKYTSVKELLEDLVLDPLDGTAIETEKSEKDESPLILSTIHSAKGLEWHTVFMIQCLDGVIPSGYSVDDNEQLDEELRLLYVACTRAKEQLFLTLPLTQSGGFGDFFTNPSRFIKDIPKDTLEPWMLNYEEEDENANQLEDGNQNLRIDEGS